MDRPTPNFGLLGALAVVWLALAAFPAPACAGDAVDGPGREGWNLGLVLGKGTGDFTVNDGEVSATSGWSGGGRIVRGRLGYYATPELQISFEYGVWRRAASGDSTETVGGTVGWVEPVDRYLGSGILAVSLYPRMGGFSLRAGLGYGSVTAQGESEAGVLVRQDATGPMLLMGFAWEFPMSHDMSMVLGTDFGRVEGGEAVSGNFAHFTATFRVHLAHGLLSEWF